MDWQVHIEADWTRLDGAKLYVYRNTGRRPEVLTGWSTVDPMEPIFTSYDEGALIPETAIRLPYSALKAIAEFLKPGPSQGETKVLADALAVERERVDAILRRATITA